MQQEHIILIKVSIKKSKSQIHVIPEIHHSLLYKAKIE